MGHRESEIFGLSNFAAWEVSRALRQLAMDANIMYRSAGCRSCNDLQRKWLGTTWDLSGVSGIISLHTCWLNTIELFSMYNAITREIEPELVPCCRKFGLRVVIYNPLAWVCASTAASRASASHLLDLYFEISGGFFAGKIASVNDNVEGRFDPNSGIMGTMYRARYLKDGYFEALKVLKEAAVSSLISNLVLKITRLTYDFRISIPFVLRRLLFGGSSTIRCWHLPTE